MHETQIEKLRWLFRDLGVDAEFTKMVKWKGPDGEDDWEDVEGIFIDRNDLTRFIDALSIAASVAA